MPPTKSEYKGMTIEVWSQSIRVGFSEVLWLGRPVEDRDIEVIKTIIDACRGGLARQIRALREQEDRLINS